MDQQLFEALRVVQAYLRTRRYLPEDEQWFYEVSHSGVDGIDVTASALPAAFDRFVAERQAEVCYVRRGDQSGTYPWQAVAEAGGVRMGLLLREEEYQRRAGGAREKTPLAVK